MNTNPQNFIVTIMAGLLAAGSLPAETLDPTKGSRFALEVYKTGFMSGKKHVFVFERYSGELDFDPRKPLQCGSVWTAAVSSAPIPE